MVDRDGTQSKKEGRTALIPFTTIFTGDGLYMTSLVVKTYSLDLAPLQCIQRW